MEGQNSDENDKKYFFGEVLESVAIAVVLAFIIRFFLFQPFYIPTGSMEPVLTKGDRIIVSKIHYRLDNPARGDIVVFKYPIDPDRDFVKRVIGLPGETLEIRDSMLYINGEFVEQPFLSPGLKYGSYGPVTIPQGHYFMMGDNRNNSEDSRFWGMLPQENIIGKTLLIYWPLNRVQLLR
ncbi:signal peptidase I [Phosphitispora sp. TUW77]|uniref:signal peptidase I n=1 Tax=Phosphitispora sp. TUW77 TaxID=3152361 RepID=UPI003AB30B24